MGAIGGQMTNIDPATGATSMMFHATPHMLTHDPHSGDYGLGFFGNSLESGSYFVLDKALGPLCFLCDLTSSTANAASHHHIVPKDAYRIAVYLEPLGLYLTSQCGTFSAVAVGMGSARDLSVTFAPSPHCKHLRLCLSKTATARPGSGFAVKGAALVRGAYQIEPAVGGAETQVQVTYTV